MEVATIIALCVAAVAQYLRSRARRAARGRRRWGLLLGKRLRTRHQVLRFSGQPARNGVLLALPCARASPRYWVRPREKQWWENEVLTQWDDQIWIQNFRMTKATLFEIAEELRPDMERSLTVMRHPIPLLKRVGIAIWKLSIPGSYREVAELFGVGRTTVCEIVIDFCLAMELRLFSRVIQLGDVGEVMNGFASLGFPHAVGAVDGTHVALICPPKQGSEFINRKSYFSMVAQATCDHRGRFIDVETGWSGKNHDAHVFVRSALCEAMDRAAYVPGHPTIRLAGEQIPPIIVADAAYPMRSWLMKPYGGALSPQQAHFNARLNRARNVVERAFARLKGRWRCIRDRLEVAEENATSVICACFILHNICETKGHALLEAPAEPHDLIIDDRNLPPPRETAENLREGNKVRDAICRFLWEHR